MPDRGKRRAAAIAALLGLAAGCGRPPETGPEPITPPPVTADECVLFPDAVPFDSAIDVALLEPVSPASAPRPGNDAERLVFRQTYETLIQLDCRGAVRPGLAESWSAERDGRAWRFVLRDDATFWDGRSLTAGQVVAGWSMGVGVTSFDSLASDGERTLLVYMDTAYESVPTLFADPQNAVASADGAGTWPLGTGPYRIEPPTPAVDFSHLVVHAFPVADAPRPPVTFRLATPTDARDLLDGGADVMVTGDPDILDYVDRRPELTSMPLPWSRTYVLLAPTRVRRLRSGDSAGAAAIGPPGLSDGIRSSLARDAVRGDARGHQGPAWWEIGGRCADERARLRALPPAIATAAYRLGGPWRVVHPQGDEAARGLAERILALATGPEPEPLAAAVPRADELDGPLVVAALEPDEFDEALESGSEFLYVVALPHRTLDPCRHLALLSERVPWLAVGWLDPAATMVPLVDTRSHVIARDGTVSLRVDWDGVVRVAAEVESGGGR
ncbi:MAG: hypothetical protein GWN99_02085 [Gemmatimonadetes bacterium]|uniref:Solute-binding protein family 5 domain-containing protein n=1 Tax=Candidatus Kutchimonas denitrificans TaxID=3056748 RepID=A0AAE5CBC0_9BACT|nr:hypothetical protein [Gemmatimonadota bacterium]NIR74235.1 hypothetical protein [Candidatus Kutchimonas denitrificans]NIR99857.1 hypothetical protein [Gemmatimonadota bacterium]NIT65446.1 hypothetical protein [Gemmatimonadota bacterium]NIU51811.1 hypothetical protein [Gemmatimonadota bacterium]